MILAALTVWALAGVRLSIVDLQSHTLPTATIWHTAAAVWILFVTASLLEAESTGLLGAVLGSATCGGALALVHFVDPPSMGFGDVRLATLNGLLCGWWGWWTALLGLAAGFAVALPWAILSLIRDGKHAHRPLGPALVVGSGGIATWNSLTSGLVPFG